MANEPGKPKISMYAKASLGKEFKGGIETYYLTLYNVDFKSGDSSQLGAVRVGEVKIPISKKEYAAFHTSLKGKLGKSKILTPQLETNATLEIRLGLADIHENEKI